MKKGVEDQATTPTHADRPSTGRGDGVRRGMQNRGDSIAVTSAACDMLSRVLCQ